MISNRTGNKAFANVIILGKFEIFLLTLYLPARSKRRNRLFEAPWFQNLNTSTATCSCPSSRSYALLRLIISFLGQLSYKPTYLRISNLQWPSSDMPTLENVTVNVVVDGQSLPEYGILVDPNDPSKITCWIESTQGKVSQLRACHFPVYSLQHLIHLYLNFHITILWSSGLVRHALLFILIPDIPPGIFLL